MNRSFNSILCLLMLCITGSICNVLALETEPLPAGFVKIMKKISKHAPESEENGGPRNIISSALFIDAYTLWNNEKNPVRKRNAQYEIQGLLFTLMNDVIFYGQFDQTKHEGLNKAVIDILVGGELDKSEITTSKRAKDIKLTTYSLGKIDSDQLEKYSALALTCRELEFSDDCFKYKNLISLQREYVLNPVSKTAMQIMHNTDTYFITRKPFSLKKYIIKRTNSESGASTQFNNSIYSACYLSDGSLLCVFCAFKQQYHDGAEGALIKLVIYNNKPQQIFTKNIKAPTDAMSHEGDLLVYPNPNISGAWNLSFIDGGYRGWYSEGSQDWIVHKSGKTQSVQLSRDFEHDNSELSNKSLASLFKGLPFPSYRASLSSYYSFKGFKNDEIGCCTWNRHYGGSMVVHAKPTSVKSSDELDALFEYSRGPAFEWSFLNNRDSYFRPFTCHKDGSLSVPFDASMEQNPMSWPSSNTFCIPSGVFCRPWNNYIHAGVNAQDKDPVDDATFFYGDNCDFQHWIKGIVAGDAADGKSLVISQRTGQVLTLSPDFKVTQVREFIAPDKSVAKAVSIMDSHKAGIFLVGNEVVLGVWK